MLFTLTLDALAVPDALMSGRVRAQLADMADLDVLAAWSLAFAIESLNAPDTGETRDARRDAMHAAINEQRVWIAFDGTRAVAMSAFNAAVTECVQIGGVYTPPDLRSHGYARCGIIHP